MSELVREALLDGQPTAVMHPEGSTLAALTKANEPSPDEAETAIRAYGQETEGKEIYSIAALAIARKHPRRALATKDLARRQQWSPAELVAWLKEHGPLWDKVPGSG